MYDDDNMKNFIRFKCTNSNDRFDITSGSLLYPIGLLTAQDVVLAGGYLDIGEEDTYQGGINHSDTGDVVSTGVMVNSDYYLYSENPYWTMSPLSNDGKVIYVDNQGTLKGADSTETYGIRPVISLNSNIVI